MVTFYSLITSRYENGNTLLDACGGSDDCGIGAGPSHVRFSFVVWRSPSGQIDGEWEKV